MLNHRLEKAIAALPALKGARDMHVLQCSSQLASGSITFHVWADAEEFPRAIVKTPRRPHSSHSIALEWQNLANLHERGICRSLIPSLAGSFEVDGATFFAYGAIPGRTMLSRYRNRVFVSRPALLKRFAGLALPVALAVHQSTTRMASGKAVADDLRNDLQALLSLMPDLPRQVIEKAEGVARSLEAVPAGLPLGLVHGDFSPYNFISTSLHARADVGLIDWEHSQPERPQHLDILRFMSACVLIDRRGQNARAYFDEMSEPGNPLVVALLKPWLERMGAEASGTWLDPQWMRQLWWHYWIHAARREQERLAENGAAGDKTYTSGLMRL